MAWEEENRLEGIGASFPPDIDPADDGLEVAVIRFFNRWPQGAPRTRFDAANAALVEALERKLSCTPS